jgi:hypothetical protein
MSNHSAAHKTCTLAAPPVLASRGAIALPDGGEEDKACFPLGSCAHNIYVVRVLVV